MKILFDNVLLNYSSISAVNEGTNYPAINIVNRILKRRYQFSTGSSDTITVTLTNDEYVNCFFWSFTNCTQIDVRLYDNLDALLDSFSFQNVDKNSGSCYFNQYHLVKKIEIELTKTDGGYIGGVGAGVYYDFGSPTSPWDEEKIDNSVVSISPDGQTQQNRTRPLDSDSFLFRDWSRSQVNLLVDLYKDYSIGHIIWVDPFEDNHNFRIPYYGILSAPIVPRKNGRRYDFELQTQEAR